MYLYRRAVLLVYLVGIRQIESVNILQGNLCFLYKINNGNNDIQQNLIEKKPIVLSRSLQQIETDTKSFQSYGILNLIVIYNNVAKNEFAIRFKHKLINSEGFKESSFICQNPKDYRPEVPNCTVESLEKEIAGKVLHIGLEFLDFQLHYVTKTWLIHLNCTSINKADSTKKYINLHCCMVDHKHNLVEVLSESRYDWMLKNIIEPWKNLSFFKDVILHKQEMTTFRFSDYYIEFVLFPVKSYQRISMNLILWATVGFVGVPIIVLAIIYYFKVKRVKNRVNCAQETTITLN